MVSAVVRLCKNTDCSRRRLTSAHPFRRSSAQPCSRRRLIKLIRLGAHPLRRFVKLYQALSIFCFLFYLLFNSCSLALPFFWPISVSLVNMSISKCGHFALLCSARLTSAATSCTLARPALRRRFSPRKICQSTPVSLVTETRALHHHHRRRQRVRKRRTGSWRKRWLGLSKTRNRVPRAVLQRRILRLPPASQKKR